ncbi:MAG: hypothetical protein COW65_12945 [Cytophagales bacterium CG18_big_fil_WC_8_21_14_2_50_42_9]|nr:MAG: hypothetical protein COW65_12945 [Cytophagales bacterium CG18_big_fil_WC_8_21_14_2_50_42_9]
MKNINKGIAAFLFGGFLFVQTSAFAQDGANKEKAKEGVQEVGQGAKSVGEGTKDLASSGVHAAGKGAKKAGKATVKGTKKAAHAVGSTAKKGAKKVDQKIEDVRDND